MPGRVIEVLSSGTALSRSRGFMTIRPLGDEEVQVPLSDIAILIAGAGVSLSTNLLLALHEQGATALVTGHNYHPSALFWPMPKHTLHCKRLDLQINAKLPLQKRLWQQVVQFKIKHQAEVLNAHNKSDNGLNAMADRVRSGDPNNMEAQAARRYWQQLMGTDFRRCPEASGSSDPNSLLNYGYAIIRAAMARAVSACGLHPALGIHHKNQTNPFRLVDDLMEPYRPLVDDKVASLRKSDKSLNLDPEVKRDLVSLLDMDLQNHAGENSPVSVSMLQVAQSFCTSLENSRVSLNYPRSILQSTQLL